MRLELGTFFVETIEWGSPTRFEEGTLYLDRDQLAAHVTGDGPVASVQLDIAKPGTSTRIIHVMDVVEPRCHCDGSSTFPGIVGPPTLAGDGRTHRLQGAAVIATAEIPESLDSQSIKEAIIDMSGPGARYSEFSSTQNLVATFTVRPEFSIPEQCAAIRLATVQLAELIGSTVANLKPQQTEVLELSDPQKSNGLPRVAYICPLMHEGDVHNTYVYGVPTQSLPTLLHPNEILDGALLTGDYHMAAMRVSTYHYQNNPIIRELYSRDGKDLQFVGSIITQALILTDLEKERSSQQAAKLSKSLGADGVVVSMSNGGHGFADLMMLCSACEKAGVKTVPILLEMADSEGGDTSLLMHLPEVNAIVSTGNMDEIVSLPEVDLVLGGSQFVDMNNYEGFISQKPHERFATSLRRLYCSCGQVGALRVTARSY